MESGETAVLTMEQELTLERVVQSVTDWLVQEGDARSTLAGAVVVLDLLRTHAPFVRGDIFTNSGQLVGARGKALRSLLARYGEERLLLKDGVTTRSTFKFEKLAEAVEWGEPFEGWSDTARGEATTRLVEVVLDEINAHFSREQMRLKLDQNESPVVWIEDLLEVAKERSLGRVEQHLVGAKLERRLPDKDVKGYAAFAADVQTERSGDFTIDKIIFHVTAAPAMFVIEKCEENLRHGLLPVLVIPRKMIERAKGLASATEGLERRISFVAIEDFVASNIIELAGAEDKPFFEILESIIEIYNERIVQSETDKSLRIELG